MSTLQIVAARRGEFLKRAAEDPLLAAPALCGLFGPERAPAEAFARQNLGRILALGGSAAA